MKPADDRKKRMVHEEGVISTCPLELDQSEQEALKGSAEVIRKAMDELTEK